MHAFPDSRQPHCPRLKPSSSPVLAAGPPTFEASLTRSRPPLITSSKPLSLRRPFLSGRGSSIWPPPRFPPRSYFLFLCTCFGEVLLGSPHRVPLLPRPLSLRSYSFLSASSLPCIISIWFWHFSRLPPCPLSLLTLSWLSPFLSFYLPLLFLLHIVRPF